jgi:heme o synthase
MSTLIAHVELTKPRITALVVFTTAAGLWLAPARPSLPVVLLTFVGTAMVVAAANVLNMYLEHDTDALMPRTRRRPLPSGRMQPRRALQFGLLLALVSIPLLTFGVGPLPGVLAAIALVGYVLLYTPMKRRTAAALLVGAVAGAMPPLIGWTAATGQFDLPGLLLFTVLFLWQVPHFLAISLLRGREYVRAGLVVQADCPAGERQARRNIVVYTLATIAVSLMFVPLSVGGTVYLVAALTSGALFLALGVQGLRADRSERWARREFLGSLAYLTVLLAVLLLDRPSPL